MEDVHKGIILKENQLKVEIRIMYRKLLNNYKVDYFWKISKLEDVKII